MISKAIFREYDIIGIFEKELHAESIKLIGYHFGLEFKGEKTVAIGFDPRSHSPIPRDYLTSGLNAAGCTVLDMGMLMLSMQHYEC